MLHPWVEFERGLWAGIDGQLIPFEANKMFCAGYATGREMLEVMKRRAAYVPPPPVRAEVKEILELKAKLRSLKSKYGAKCRRLQRIEKAWVNNDKADRYARRNARNARQQQEART